MVTYSHNTSLMLVAIIVSVVAAFTGLALTRRISTLPDWTRKTLVAMSAVVIGGGIWTMHFVTMLAIEFSVPVGYDVVHTLMSGLVSILMVGIALLVLHYTHRTRMVLNVAGLIFGAGIVSMHYIGMSAMRGAVPSYSRLSVVIALIAAAAFCIFAIRMAYGKRSKETIVSGGLLLGLSVVVVHHTAMLGIRYSASQGYDNGTISLANSTLAIILVIAVFLICAAFLLVSATFLTSPEQANQKSLINGSERITSAQSLPASEANVLLNNTLATKQAGLADHSKANVSHATSDSPETLQIVSDDHNHENDRKHDQTAENSNTESDLRIPYEQNKKISFVDHRTVGAIRADGRYTHLYTQQGVFFCPWSITEAEKKLADTPFYRSHRSYLVNVAKITSYEKRKDSAVCIFEGYDQLSKVPVSRTRVTGLMQRLGLA